MKDKFGIERVTRFRAPDASEHTTHNEARVHWTKVKRREIFAKTLDEEFGSYLPQGLVEFVLERFDVKPKVRKVK